MRAVTLEREYNIGDRFGYFICSDIHFDSPEHDSALFKKEFEYAKSMNCRILILGDIFDLINHRDAKRFTPSRNKYGAEDNALNYAIDEAYEALSPYADLIDVIMLGNHESACIRFHNIDPTVILINRLNRECGANIHYMGYNSYIRYQYRYANGNSSKTYDIKACHGLGGSAPVTKGTITQSRIMNMHDADLYISGHSHQKLVLPSEYKSYLDKLGNIRLKERKVIVTGAFVKPIQQKKNTNSFGANPYEIQYGDLMKGLQGTGGAILEHTFDSRDELTTRIIV